MSVDTKGVVVFQSKEDKNPFLVAGVIESALKHSEHCQKHSPAPGIVSSPQVEVTLRTTTNSLDIHFKQDDGKDRALKVFFDVEYDHRDKGEHSISLMMGHFGRSVEIMEEVLSELELAGDNCHAYIQPNDATDPYVTLKQYQTERNAEVERKICARQQKTGMKGLA